MMTWEEIFRFVSAMLASLGGGGAIVWGLSSFLGKVWAGKILQNEQLQLDKLKKGYENELDKLKKEHDVMFSTLHSERAEAIKEIAQKLDQLSDAWHSILKQFQLATESPLEDKISELVNVHNEYRVLHKKYKIYFKKDTAQLMHDIAIASRDTKEDVDSANSIQQDIGPMSKIRDEQIQENLKRLLSEKNDFWDMARNRYSNDLSRLIEELETTFRQLLGVS